MVELITDNCCVDKIDSLTIIPRKDHPPVEEGEPSALQNCLR